MAAPASPAPRAARPDLPAESWVQSLRRNVPIHMCDPATPGLTLCGWSCNSQPSHRLLANPSAEGDADMAPLC
eukprot:8241563-Alexandrium_andersonii.AAC.1